MDKEAIVLRLTQNHNDFLDYMNNLSDSDFNYSANKEKWTAGQEMLHIDKSIAPLIKAFKMPKLALRASFGLANRPSKSYDELVEKYKKKLNNTQVTLGRFAPKKEDVPGKEDLIEKLSQRVEKLTNLIAKFKEKELDKYILPHPLLGKLTLREMLYFTAYHVNHHLNNSKNNLNK